MSSNPNYIKYDGSIVPWTNPELVLCRDCDDNADVGGQCGLENPNACESCRKLSELQNKIKETKRLLNGLKRVYREVKEQANHHHDPFIHRLPPEIASKIFEFCIPDIMALDLSDRSLHSHELWAPLVLSAVCRRWRSISHSTPQLWRNLPLICDPHSGGDMEEEEQWVLTRRQLVRQWIDRAGELPISINFYSSTEDYILDLYEDSANRAYQMIDVLNDYAHRWQYLKFSGHLKILYTFSTDTHSLPQLRMLELDLNSGLRGMDGILNLRPRYLERLEMPGSMLAIVDFDWKHLTQLTLFSGSLSQCFGALQYGVSLTHCIFQKPFSNLSCPALKTLKISDPARKQDRVEMSFIVDFLWRSGCSLEELLLFCGSLSSSSIVSLCEGIPTLQHLSLVFSAKDPVPTTLFSHLAVASVIDSRKEPRFLPALRLLNVMGENIEYNDWKMLPDIFCTRTSAEEMECHRYALKSVTISVSDPPVQQPDEKILEPDLEFDIDEETLDRILWLRDSSDVEWKIICGEDRKDMVALAVQWYSESWGE
ncbi:hypothetical protein BDN70DRAFT_599780 [Pholiota conissans]|uniref:F-box domain-containing protein n=1 Tax=Pholiota conissans TaxID=109636 RepID=A0A9P5Z4P4_9AGAR|nr:hypothetical protein BDN70DRAFT_599780 [Pholiota conissans]